MTQTRAGMDRRLPRTAAVAGLMMAAAVLAGCSSSGDSAGDVAATMMDSGGEAAAYAEDEAAQEGALQEGAEESADLPDGRSFIVTGSLYLTVEDPLAAANDAEDVVQSAGGRIDARNETAADEYDGGTASLVLRVPQPALDGVVDDLRELGTVDHYSTESRDVTTQVTDLEARISTLRDSTGRIQALLLEAQDISDIIKLEDELASRQAELESLEAQQRGLADQVSMSTIELSLTTEPVVMVDDSPRTFIDGLGSGWDGLVAFVSGALVVTGVLLPWLAVAALIAGATFLAIRAQRSRSSRRAGETMPDARAPEDTTAPENHSAP